MAFVENYFEWRPEMRLAETDLTKEYDRVTLQNVWVALGTGGAAPSLVNALRASMGSRLVQRTSCSINMETWRLTPVGAVRCDGDSAAKVERAGSWTRHCRQSSARPCLGRRHLACRKATG